MWTPPRGKTNPTNIISYIHRLSWKSWTHGLCSYSLVSANFSGTISHYSDTFYVAKPDAKGCRPASNKASTRQPRPLTILAPPTAVSNQVPVQWAEGAWLKGESTPSNHSQINRYITRRISSIGAEFVARNKFSEILSKSIQRFEDYLVSSLGNSSHCFINPPGDRTFWFH